VALAWDYSVASPTTSPFVRFVLIDYYSGDATIPAPVAIHWQGRTYFAFATDGSEENDVVVVYDKKNAFTVYENWRIKGFTKFRGRLTAIQDYALVELEAGYTDLGARIDGEARTGIIAGESLLALQDVEANLVGSNNAYSPDTNGAIEIVPMAGEDELDAVWILPVPPSPDKEISRVHGEPADEFDWSWGQAYSLVFRTSQQTTNNKAVADQQEVIQQVDLKLITADMSRNYTGK
jgi:hypothetical protein